MNGFKVDFTSTQKTLFIIMIDVNCLSTLI